MSTYRALKLALVIAIIVLIIICIIGIAFFLSEESTTKDQVINELKKNAEASGSKLTKKNKEKAWSTAKGIIIGAVVTNITIQMIGLIGAVKENFGMLMAYGIIVTIIIIFA